MRIVDAAVGDVLRVAYSHCCTAKSIQANQKEVSCKLRLCQNSDMSELESWETVGGTGGIASGVRL